MGVIADTHQPNCCGADVVTAPVPRRARFASSFSGAEAATFNCGARAATAIARATHATRGAGEVVVFPSSAVAAANGAGAIAVPRPPPTIARAARTDPSRRAGAEASAGGSISVQEEDLPLVAISEAGTADAAIIAPATQEDRNGDDALAPTFFFLPPGSAAAVRGRGGDVRLAPISALARRQGIGVYSGFGRAVILPGGVTAPRDVAAPPPVPMLPTFAPPRMRFTRMRKSDGLWRVPRAWDF